MAKRIPFIQPNLRRQEKIDNMMGKDMDKPKEFTGRHMLMIMVAFFGVIIAVNLTMAILANTSWTGLVVKNSYVESQHFNTKLAESRAQAALKWQGTLSSGSNGLQFVLRKPDGQFVNADMVSVTFRRPATEALDQKYVLASMGEGKFVWGDKLRKGAWTAEIKAEITTEGEKSTRWHMTYNILVDKKGLFSPVTNKVK